MKQAIKTAAGLQPYQVYQRTANNKASIEVRGILTERTHGVIEARLTKSRQPLPGFEWREIRTEGIRCKM